MKKVKMLLILAFFSIFVFVTGCTQTTPTPTVDPEDGESYKIEIDELENGIVTANKSEAKAGETVKLTVTPDENYKLLDGSLKVNDVDVEGTSFEMPEEDVLITAEFVLDAPEMSVVKTDLMVESTHNKKTAVAYISTKFESNSLTVKAMVEDSKLVESDDYSKGDGLSLYFSRINSTEGFVKDVTFKLQANLKGGFDFYSYNGTTFVEQSNSSVEYTVSYFVNSKTKAPGYVAEYTIPYAVLGLNSSNVKENLTMLPVLYNTNLANKNAVVNTVVDCDYEKQNTYVVLVDDDAFEQNPYFFGTYKLTLPEGIDSYWDISKDYEPSHANYANRKVTLTNSNNDDNCLIFNNANGTELYITATFKLTNIFNNDRWGKFGFKFLNKYGEGFFYYIDAHFGDANPATPAVNLMKDERHAAYELFYDGQHHYTEQLLPISYVPAYDTVKVSVYRNGTDFYLFVNDLFVYALRSPSNIKADDEITPQIYSFNLGVEVTNYYATCAPTEIKDLGLELPALGVVESQNFINDEKIGTYWNLDGDSSNADRKIVLANSNGTGNHNNLTFKNVTSTTFYVQATFKLTDVFNGEKWGKFGIKVNDATGKGFAFCFAASKDNGGAGTPSEFDSSDAKAGFVNFVDFNKYDWSTHHMLENTYKPHADTVKLAIYRVDGTYKLYVNDVLVHTLNNPNGLDGSAVYSPVITSLNLGLEVTNYIATSDINVINSLLPR